MRGLDVLVVGGGIAGIGAAYQLARRGARVVVLEREDRAFALASSKNAAIFRQAEPDPLLCRLARESRALYDEVLGEGSWLEARGALYLAPDPELLGELLAAAREAGLEHELLDGAALKARLPEALRGGPDRVGMSCPSDGALDLRRVASGLLEAARAEGVVVQTRAEVAELVVRGGAVVGVMLSSGETLQGGAVVLAAGAWAGALPRSAGLGLPLSPKRRHVARVVVFPSPDPTWPVLWRVAPEVYLRPSVAEILASPCDEEEVSADDPPRVPEVSPTALAALDERLGWMVPKLRVACAEAWACLRTFAPDKGLVVGADPRAEGLYWLAALGGSGMTVGMAAARLLCDAIEHGRDVEPALSVARLL